MLLNVRVSLLLVSLFFVFGSQAIAQENKNPEFGPFSAEEAAQKFVLHPDCKIELVAAEPDVIDPVHIAFNTDGKMWVVEYTDYPNGPGDGQPGLSRIRVLSDDDEDGRYNNPVTFAEKLLFANGLMFWKDGVIVTTDGKIQFMRDTDGDGKSDDTQIWFQGFATENPQLRHNHPQLAMDCKIYVANGLRGGNIVPGPDNPWGLDPKAKPLSISGRDFRFDPLTGKYEAIAGMGQFGMAFDAYGNRFVCTNRNPCRQIVLEDEQLKLTPGLRIPRFYEDVAAAGEDSKLYPLSRTWTTSNLHANQFTAACGVLIYNDFALGEKFSGNSFTCDPTANLVHREILMPAGPTFVGKPGREGVEFLATRDEWFRPVNLSHGPDGSLYIVDMYRAVIEHPQFMPVELKDRPDLLMGTDRGRIWKISSKKALPRKSVENSIANFSDVKTKFLINELSIRGVSEWSVWRKEHAFRILFEQQNKSIAQQIRERQLNRFNQGKEIFDGAQVLGLFNGTGQLNTEDLRHYINLNNFEYINNAIKSGTQKFGDDSLWIEVLNNYFEELSPEIDRRFGRTEAGYVLYLNWKAREVFTTLGGLPWRDFSLESRSVFLTLLLHQVETGIDPYWLSTYLGISARTESLMVLEDLLSAIKDSESTLTVAPVVHDIAQLVARQNQAGQVELLLGSIPANTELDEVTKMAALAGLADGYPGGSTAIRGQIAKLNSEQHAAVLGVLSKASSQFAAEKLATQLLPIVTSLLSIADDEESLQQLVSATGSGDATRASLALSALLKRPADQVNPALVELLPRRRGAVRRSILQAMASNVSRAPALLDEIEAGRVPALEIDATMEKALYRLSDKEVVARAKKLLKREPPADRVKVLADYQQVLKMKSDPLRGKAVFEKNCATCHKVGGVGVNVAPDISDSRTKTPDFYLMNILDPNRAIDANYFSFNILDTDGKVHSGIVASETSTSITLKQPEGKLVTIDRENIEHFKNTGVSLMPVGLEQKINKQQMADVISFIKNWRYLDGQIPKEVIK